MKNLLLKLSAIFLVFLCSIYFSLGNFLEKDWLSKNKMNLGLDIRGGLSLVIEADLENHQEVQMNRISAELKKLFNKKTLTRKSEISLLEAEKDLEEDIKSAINNITNQYSTRWDGNNFIIKIKEEFFSKMEASILDRIIEVLRYRIDATGLQEITLQREGKEKILIQIPGAQDNDDIKKVLSQTGSLTFHLVDQNFSQKDFEEGKIALDLEILPMLDGQGSLAVEIQPLMRGEVISDAQNTTSMGRNLINFKLNDEGSKTFAKITKNNTGKALALVLDKKIIMAPMINEPILTGSGQISGSFTSEEARDLAILLRSGALPVPIKIVQESLVGPSLGEESIEEGVNAVTIACLSVILIMILVYRSLGIIASLALVCNLFLMIALLTLMGATLTLPGLAGMALTLGMAVDANVLIYERVKEEKGKISLEKSLNKGYNTAIRTILDANITTILVALILYGFGSSSIKSFAITLLLGIGSSLLTAVLFTKVFINCWLLLFRPRTI